MKKRCPHCGCFMSTESKLARVAINARTGHELLAYRNRERCGRCDYSTPITGGDFELPTGYMRIPPWRPTPYKITAKR